MYWLKYTVPRAWCCGYHACLGIVFSYDWSKQRTQLCVTWVRGVQHGKVIFETQQRDFREPLLTNVSLMPALR